MECGSRVQISKGVKVRKLLSGALTGLLLLPTLSDVAYGASAVKYRNQRAGQFCKNLDIGKSVSLPDGSKLKCATATGAKKPKWKEISASKQVPSRVLPSSAPTNPTQCTPRSLPGLPIASQRMSILKMDWKKDAAGYVTVSLTIRNDNDVNLRVVQYQFFYWYGGEQRTTAYSYQSTYGTTTVEHFFSQDTEKLMGVDNTPGAWLSGQSRVFLIDTASILDCSKISVLEGDFNVIQGIGANP